MQYIEPILFAILVIASFAFFFKKAKFIYRNINLGRDLDMSGHVGERLTKMFLVAFGQQKMFKKPVVAILHGFIYVAFIITQVELIEVFIDGFSGNHRLLFQAFQGNAILEGFYNFVISFIEVLSVLAFIATVAFLSRRNLLKIPRFRMPELNGWPKLDANLILIAEIVLIVCIMMMNGADVAANPGKYHFAISSFIGPLLQGIPESGLHAMEKVGWWGHIIVVFAFLNYIPYSKHLHIALAFPNTYYSRLYPQGEITNMPEITKEVKAMLDPNAAYAAPAEGEAAVPHKFGAKDITDLTWKNLLEAYSCTECGRCTAACPANQTGKKLSPRKIMMDTRDRMEELGTNLDQHGPDFKDNKQLLGDYITVEELRACTTCQACVEECPVNISPLDIIVQLRRALIMEDSNSPEEWNLMFTNVENNGAPWQFSPLDRDKWASEI